MNSANHHITKRFIDFGFFNVMLAETDNIGEEQQYDEKHLPISHYLGTLKKDTGKPSYCLFIAPTINEACIAHFYALHRMNISYYGGESYILPLSLPVFRKMVEDSYKADYIPNPSQVRCFFEWSVNCAKNSQSEKEWYERVQEKAREWLS